MFEKRLNDLCMNFLGDYVFAVRVAATSNLARVARLFGVEWATAQILPKVCVFRYWK